MRSYKWLRLLALAFGLWFWFLLPLQTLPFQQNASAQAYSVSSSTSTPTRASTALPTPQSSSPASGDTVFPAWLALVGGVLVALIGVGFGIYQLRRTAALEREKLNAQRQLEHERIRYQARIDAERAAQERQRQHQEMSDEKARTAVEHAQTQAERLQAYRDVLKADPRIAKLQILDMSHPLDLVNIYVQVRLHQDSKPGYELDPSLLAAEATRDPNELLQASRLALEQRISRAIKPEVAITNHKRCVFVGDPGAGKTTLLKYLTLRAASNQLQGLPDLPIHIELSAFASSGYQDLLDFVSTRWDDRYGFPKADARSCMEEALKAGNALLLLDALDEAVMGKTNEEADASYKRVTDAITDLATRFHQSPIAVTARKAGYYQHARLIGFTELEMLDFRQIDINAFIRRWFANSPRQRQHATADDLIARLSRNARLQALAANPLLLSLIVIVYEDQLELPEQRAELYRQCVDILLSKWDSSREIRRRREFTSVRKLMLLKKIAWHFHNQGQRYLPESELLNVITDYLPAINVPSEQHVRILEEIAAENGLLKEQAHHWYGFLHLTLQEYFVALYIADQHLLNELLTHLGDPWWEEVLLLYAGCAPDASPLLQILMGEDNHQLPHDDIFHTHLVLAGRCLAARPPSILKTSLYDDITDQLFQKLTDTPFTDARNRLMETLTEMRGKAVIAEFMRLLADKNVDTKVRSKIPKVLIACGDHSVVPEMLRLLADKQMEVQVRINIVSSLPLPRIHQVRSELLRLFADKQGNVLLRAYIASRLVMAGERLPVSELQQFLIDKQLGPLEWLRIISNLHKDDKCVMRSNLLAQLHNRQIDIETYENITFTLSHIGDISIAPELLRVLIDRQVNAKMQESLATALGRMGERSVVPELLHLLVDEQVDTQVRARIATALGILGDRSVAPELLHLLVNGQIDIQMRVSVAIALGKLGERSVVSELARLLSNEQVNIEDRTSTLPTAIGVLGERSIVPKLLRMLAEGQIDHIERVSITRTLCKLEECEVVPEVLRLLTDKQVDISTSRDFARDLGKLVHDTPTLSAMAALLQDADIADAIYSALWVASRRMRVRIFIGDGPEGTQVKVVPLA